MAIPEERIEIKVRELGRQVYTVENTPREKPSEVKTRDEKVIARTTRALLRDTLPEPKKKKEMVERGPLGSN
jgi:hypothetical protein